MSRKWGRFPQVMHKQDHLFAFAFRTFDPYLPGMKPMDTFNPDTPCHVHDKLNDRTFDWKPEWAGNYRQYADDFDDGIIEWDGLLLDGWMSIVSH